MPPLAFSRYIFTVGIKDADGNLFLTEREPYRFVAFPDNKPHTVVVGDTLHNLADRYFEGVVDNPADLYFVIADFQPDPILDPTLTLTPGRVLIIPSKRVVTDEIFSEARRQ